MRTLSIAVLAAAVLVGCGPGDRGEQGSARIDPAQREADRAALVKQFDPCASAATAPQTLCQASEAASLAEAVAATLSEQVAELSPEGRRIALENARAWVEANVAACEAEADPAVCFRSALAARREEAAQAVAQIGPYTFQRVVTTEQRPVPAEAAGGLGIVQDAPTSLMRSVAQPRIDNPHGDPVIDRFNAAVAPRRSSASGDLMEEQVTYEVAYAGPELVSVRFDSYEYALGAAHPNTSVRAVTILMQDGSQLRPETVFAPNSGWQDLLTERALAGLAKSFEEFGGAQPDRTDVRDTVTKPHNWVITEDALVLIFPPYSVGPHALGALEVAVPWTDLRERLNPDAPAPIRAGEG